MDTFSNTWRHIRRSPYQAFAAISIMSLTFIVSGMFFLINFGSSIVLKSFEQKPKIIVFFKDTKNEIDIKALEEKLKLVDKVASVKYVSKDEALVFYKEEFKNDPLLLEMVSADILPASIEVSAIKIEYLPELAEMLKAEPEIQEIVYQEDVVNLLVSWTNTFRTMGLVLILFLGFVSLFTVVTVIGMKIALRKEEIEILQLVGGSHWYIRFPFLVEGIIYGILGALVGWMTNTIILKYAEPFLSAVFFGIPLFPIPSLFFIYFLLGMLSAGWFLGVLASLLAINRYLH